MRRSGSGSPTTDGQHGVDFRLRRSIARSGNGIPGPVKSSSGPAKSGFPRVNTANRSVADADRRDHGARSRKSLRCSQLVSAHGDWRAGSSCCQAFARSPPTTARRRLRRSSASFAQTTFRGTVVPREPAGCATRPRLPRTPADEPRPHSPRRRRPHSNRAENVPSGQITDLGKTGQGRLNALYDFENRRTQFVQGVFAKAIGSRRVAAFDRRVEALPPPRNAAPGTVTSNCPNCGRWRERLSIFCHTLVALRHVGFAPASATQRQLVPLQAAGWPDSRARTVPPNFPQREKKHLHRYTSTASQITVSSR